MSQSSAGGTPIASGQSCLVAMLVMVADTQSDGGGNVFGGRYYFSLWLKKRRYIEE
ncbi:unnamed protein product [Meloidogyne enterolobii]|uniref:Uncharacterized protein n=1 Tax=Meloidogyne enterolobii TaxID=390850 RepID=A0ACB0XL74_MELEN